MPNPVLTKAIDMVADGRHDLEVEEAAAVLREIMEGRASEVETAAFLIGLRAKGETVDEVVGLATTMRELATPVAVDDAPDLLDTAGTGGGAPSFNVSTAAALVAAAAGVKVAKHGNRSNTSKCGSADVLEALGARIDLAPEAVAQCIEEVGFGFMFAPAHHQAMKHVVPVRKALGVRTVFNLLGPLTNPAGANRQVVGVSDPAVMGLMAHALQRLGTTAALVVSSRDGLDELSPGVPTQAMEVRDGQVRPLTISPFPEGVRPKVEGPVELPTGTPEENARIIRDVFSGMLHGPAREAVLINAGAALYAAGRVDDVWHGRMTAEGVVDSTFATGLLDRWIEKTRELAA